jgi:acetyltransferase
VFLARAVGIEMDQVAVRAIKAGMPTIRRADQCGATAVSTYRLEKILAPRSIALVGASPRESSVGRKILHNLREAGFAGPLQLVNPRHPQIDGLATVGSVDRLDGAPDLLVIAAPPATIPGIVAAAGAKGCGGAVIITAGLGHGAGSLADASVQAARAQGLRLIGPNCLGVMVPGARLNASFAASAPHPGDLALLSQSGAIAAGMVEWAAQRKVGFSAVVSLGDQVDVDLADCLDYFAVDRSTRAILLYVESIVDARKFMSAARAAARAKPVVVIKSGRHAQGARAAATHTGALAGSDEVYDAAFRRAGLLRVNGLDQLFAAAEMLGRVAPFPGKRLAILTNGGGIGVLAVDRLIDLGGTLAEISPGARATLDRTMPPLWSRANPVDIAGDSDASRYATALDALLADPANDAVLVMNVPTALASPADAARAVVGVAQQQAGRGKPVFSAWIGEDASASGTFEAAGIAHFADESHAVEGFMHLVRYREAQDALMATPPSLPQEFRPRIVDARRIVQGALQGGAAWLDPLEVAALLAAYAIPASPVALARDPDEAARVAAPLLAGGGTVVVKILSPDIVHKSEVGGVRLNLTSAQAVAQAAFDILARARAAKPAARITGVTIHPMVLRPKARELIAGIADDPTFGPVVAFGAGGTAVEVISDKALALPPLDMRLARDLIGRTRIARVLDAYRDVPAADTDGVALVLIKLAQLAADIPEIREVDLNPLLADQHGVVAVDARVAIGPVDALLRGARGHPRFAVRPYPTEWEREATLRDGSAILVRPIRPEDEVLYADFFAGVTDDDLRLRFFAPVRKLSHIFIARFTQIDYARAMAFIALEKASGRMLGVVRLHASANYDSGEYAILVRSDLKGRGLGWMLMQTIIEYARSEGLREIEGQVLRDNTTMIAMCRELGFSVKADPDDASICNVKFSIVAAGVSSA